MNDPLYSSNLLSSKILAAVLLLNDQSLNLIESKADTFGFSCRFHTKHPLIKEQLLHLEQLMRTLVAENKIKVSSMVADVAYNYLLHKGDKKQAQQVKHYPKGLLTVLEIDHYIEVMDQEIEFSLDQISHFKLLDVSEYKARPDDFYQKQFIVKGVFESDLAGLKDLCKIYKNYQTKNHLITGIKSGLFDQLFIEGQERPYFLEKGIKKIVEFKSALHERFYSLGFKEIYFSSLIDDLYSVLPLLVKSRETGLFFHEKNSTQLESSERGLGLFSLEQTESISATLLLDSKKVEALIAQIIAFFNELSLEVSFVIDSYSEPVKKEFNSRSFWVETLGEKVWELQRYRKGEESYVTIYSKDTLGRDWEIGSFEILGKKAPFYFVFHLLSFELLLALVLEKD